MPELGTATQKVEHPSVVRTTRPENLLETIDRTFDNIARRAFEIFERNGRNFGRDAEDWFKAESELLHPVHVTVTESGDTLEVKAEAPGFREKELEISVEPRRLTIAGKRESTKEEKKGKVISSTSCSDQILRVVELPTEIEANKVTATLKNGVFNLHMPKVAKAQTVKIQPKAVAQSGRRFRSGDTWWECRSIEKSPGVQRIQRRKSVRVLEETEMRVRDVMVETPAYCTKDTNLGQAVEILWTRNCGFLPVVDNQEKLCGVVTDRDICIALGTRNRLPGEITVGEVASNKIYSCRADDDIHAVLSIMSAQKIHRLPVVDAEGKLQAIVSMDDVILRARSRKASNPLELSLEDVVDTLQYVSAPSLPVVVPAKTAVA